MFELKTIGVCSVIACNLCVPLQADQVQNFRLDKPHTIAAFTVGYTGGLTAVEGRFVDLSGSISVDPNDLTTGSVSVSFNTASLDTDHPRRNADLWSAAWFNVEEFPTMTFDGVPERRDGDNWVLLGELRIKDVTRRLEIPFVRNHDLPVVWASGRPHLGFSGSITLDRRDYRLPEAGEGGIITSIGKLFVSPEVDIRLVVQAIGPGLDDLLFETIVASGADAGIEAYWRLKGEHAEDGTYSFEAGSLTFLVPRLVRAEQQEAALGIAELNLNEHPESHFSHYGLAVAYQALGRVEEALAAVNQALEIRPGHRLSTRLKSELGS